jgi:hypothetical protein
LKNDFNLAFPPTFIFSNSLSFHLSIVVERTKLMCTPRLLCFPAHPKQMKMPYFTETH